ncbi:Ankyrin repeat family protein [Melia azedarach]|uniref:Ankyrin repeat family protein n=1 Tax=Melia azedarach TaxID=155640 RepID=A0ACC1WWW7_MELAZ|nr:Ankyrin repeat family protein [Melia azedarach]
MAASLGYKEIVEYLYQERRDSLTEDDRMKLFIICIETDLYDVASQLLTDYPDLATARAANDETALHVLARKDLNFSNMSNLGTKVVENKRLQALQLVKCIWQRIVLLSEHELSQLIAKPTKLIFDAAERGNLQFLSALIHEYPDLIWKVDNPGNKYTIFHIAVKNRQVDVFKLIYDIGSSKDLILTFKDNEGNNILHLAAMMAPQDRLNIVSGEALQFQRELMWFKEVEKVVPKMFAEARNMRGFTPRDLFLEEHTELRKKGEKWMKETANACIVVATLIATVAFTAALTVPGGNNQDTGFPVFIEKVSFEVFAISDAISLVFSLTSMATFLNIFVSRYAAEDMLWRLPRKFYIGMLSLLISLVALLAVFSTIFFIIFNNTRLWIAILVAVVVPTPLYMFLLRNINQLLYDVFSMTFNLDSPFQQGHGLFLMEGGPRVPLPHQESKKNSTAESNV